MRTGVAGWLICFVLLLGVVSGHDHHSGHGDHQSGNQDHSTSSKQGENTFLINGDKQQLWSKEFGNKGTLEMEANLVNPEFRRSYGLYLMLVNQEQADELQKESLWRMCAANFYSVDYTELIKLDVTPNTIYATDMEKGEYYLYSVDCYGSDGTDYYVDLSWKADGLVTERSGDSKDSDHSGHSSEDSDRMSEHIRDFVASSDFKAFEGTFFYGSIVQGAVAGIWFLTWIRHRKGSTKLQKFLTFIPLTACAGGLSGWFCLEQMEMGYQSKSLFWTSFVFGNLHRAAFFIGLQYAALGMSTKRSNISCKKKLIATLLGITTAASNTAFDIMGGWTVAAFGGTFILTLYRIFSTSAKTTNGFLKDVRKMREEGRDPKNTNEHQKLSMHVVFRFFLVLFTMSDTVVLGMTHYVVESPFVQIFANEGVKFLMTFTVMVIFRVRPFNKRTSMSRSDRHRRRRMMNSRMSFRDVDYVGLDDIPPENGQVAISVNPSAPSVSIQPVRIEIWKCAKCTYINEGPSTHCQSCEVWSCGTCSVDNPLNAAICTVCDNARPANLDRAQQHEQLAQNVRPEQWTCEKCSFVNALDAKCCEGCEVWTCLSCTMKNVLSATVCEVCGKDRPTDLALKLHQEAEEMKLALREAEQQNLLLKQELNYQQAPPHVPVVSPVPAPHAYLELKAQEAPRHMENVEYHQAAPVEHKHVYDAVAVVEDKPQIQMDVLKAAVEEPVRVVIKESVALRSVVSDDALIVYDTPQAPPKQMEEEEPKQMMIGSNDMTVGGFMDDTSIAMTSIVSNSAPIMFDSVDSSASSSPAPGLATRVHIIDIGQPSFQVERVELEVNGAEEQVEDQEIEGEEQQQQVEVEDFLGLESFTTTQEEEPAPEVSEPESELVTLISLESAPEEEEPMEVAGNHGSSVSLLQFLMELNANGDLNDDDLGKLMKQIREKPEDKQTLLESLDASQGSKDEFFKMIRLFGFIG